MKQNEKQVNNMNVRVRDYHSNEKPKIVSFDLKVLMNKTEEEIILFLVRYPPHTPIQYLTLLYVCSRCPHTYHHIHHIIITSFDPQYS